jgi:hypothetical protein
MRDTRKEKKIIERTSWEAVTWKPMTEIDE